jgi:hypothetical protein
MQDLRLGDQLALFDHDATVAAYRALRSGGAERCGCVHCRNFAAQRATLYPPAFLELFDQLGIDPNKEGEAFDMMGPFEATVRPTGGWFYFIGELSESGEKLIQESNFQYWFQPVFPRPPACFGDRVAAIEFLAQVPWVLDESPA